MFQCNNCCYIWESVFVSVLSWCFSVITVTYENQYFYRYCLNVSFYHWCREAEFYRSVLFYFTNEMEYVRNYECLFLLCSYVCTLHTCVVIIWLEFIHWQIAVLSEDLLRKISCVLDMNVTVIVLVVKYKVVQIWPGQTVTCLHTNTPGHIWTTLY
jgi:hypothetical protein